MGVDCSIYSVNERDIDLLIMREIISEGNLTDELRRAAGIPEGKLISIGNSIWDNKLGETDILLIFDVENIKYALLIEDKINAKHQPMQHDRYIMRGQKGVENKSWDKFEILLIAPEKYIKKESEARKYLHVYTYEQLKICFDNETHFFDTLLIEKALQKEENTYDLVENKNVTEFWKEYLIYQERKHRKLECANKATTKGTYSSWAQYYVAMRKELILYHKITNGYIDLQFSGLGGHEYELENLLKEMGIDPSKEGFSVVNTSKSASLRISIDSVDITKPFEDIPDETKECWFLALEKMTSLVERFDKEKLKEFIQQKKGEIE